MALITQSREEDIYDFFWENGNQPANVSSILSFLCPDERNVSEVYETLQSMVFIDGKGGIAQYVDAKTNTVTYGL